MNVDNPGDGVETEQDNIQRHQSSGAFVPGFNPLGQSNNYMTPSTPTHNNQFGQGGRGHPGGRGNYAQRGIRGQVTPDSRAANSVEGSDSSWTRVGDESDESELAQRMGNQSNSTSGAPGRVSQP